MKKIVSLMLALLMLVALGACAKKAPEAEAPKAEAPKAEAPKADAPKAEAPKATDAPAEPAKADKLVVNTVILKEADDSMKNTYAVLAVNDKAPFVDADGKEVKDVALNTAGADALYQWLNSQEALDMAAAYGVEEFGANLFYVLEGIQPYAGEIAPATEETKTIRLSTTTSVKDSGLLGKLLPVFEEKYGYTVEVYSAGTGKSIANAKMGNADIILVHAKKQEDAFVADGFARVVEGFKAIADGKFLFISRGDKSGTHTKELALWPADLGITAEADSFKAYTDWYISANAGMGACLVMAEQQGAYILTDTATFLSFVANDGIIK